MFIPRRNLKNQKTGFTLVELLVTITIFVMLTAVVLWNQSKFNSTILLTNLAYDTALTIRQAQTYGINIKKFNKDDESFFPYGVHFDMRDTKSFILFADKDWNGVSSNGLFLDVTNAQLPTSCNESGGCVNRYNIKRGNYIKQICATTSNGGERCDYDTVDIVFTRPNPDARIIVDSVSEASKVRIILRNVNDENEREIVVQENGLISIVK